MESATPEARAKYFDILSSVFSQVEPEKLRYGMGLFDPDTRFYAVGDSESYASVLFVTPVNLAGIRIGGIGGVCTRKEFRGLGYGRSVIERAIDDTSSSYVAILLWTRIPGYFTPVGFVEMTELFVADEGGSSPMILFHDQRIRSVITALRNLPRDYF